MHWLGIVVRRSTLENPYDEVCMNAESDPAFLVTKLDRDRCIVCDNKLVRAVVRRGHHVNQTDITFRYPLGLAILFAVFPLATVIFVIGNQVKGIADIVFMVLFVAFMSGIPLCVWAFLHRFSLREAESMTVRLAEGQMPDGD